jgi:hypothetical protein
MAFTRTADLWDFRPGARLYSDDDGIVVLDTG